MLKIYRILLIFSFFSGILSFYSAPVIAEVTNETVLPELFKVYYHADKGLSRKPFKGAKEKEVPINNEFTEKPGCYVSCLSRNKKDAIYSFDTNAHVIGQIRVKGYYHNGFCQPKGHEDQDLRISKVFKAKCEESFPERCEKQSCWASGKHGGWY